MYLPWLRNGLFQYMTMWNRTKSPVVSKTFISVIKRIMTNPGWKVLHVKKNASQASLQEIFTDGCSYYFSLPSGIRPGGGWDCSNGWGRGWSWSHSGRVMHLGVLKSLFFRVVFWSELCPRPKFICRSPNPHATVFGDTAFKKRLVKMESLWFLFCYPSCLMGTRD